MNSTYVRKRWNLEKPLPSVTDRLCSVERDRAIFVKPVLGCSLKKIPIAGTPHLSPETLSVREMRLENNHVIPVHIHMEKMTSYYFLGPKEGLSVAIFYEDGVEEQKVPVGFMTVVPPGCPHFIAYFSEIDVDCEIFVISSTNNHNDIRWEVGADELVKNHSRV